MEKVISAESAFDQASDPAVAAAEREDKLGVFRPGQALEFAPVDHQAKIAKQLKAEKTRDGHGRSEGMIPRAACRLAGTVLRLPRG